MSRAGAPQSAESAADAQSSSSEETESTSTFEEMEENRQALATRVALATGTGHRHSLFVLRQHANSGASQSTVPSVAPSGSQPVIGRREAVLALTVLLNECWNNEAGAVDITDGHGFDWKRFVANTMEHLEIAAMGLEKVFALRTAVSGSPKLAFCTTGTTWKILDPTQTNYKNTRLPGLRGMSSDWRLEPLFLQPQTPGRNWMRMR